MKVLIAGAVLMLASHAALSTEPVEARFAVIGNGAVLQDQQTGLQWMRCSLGQEWREPACAGRPERYTWDQAMVQSAVLADQTDWRLPTVHELQTLEDYRMFNPAIDPESFPNTPPANFWTSSEAASDAFYAWSIHFGSGFSNWRHKRQRFEVRLVRSAD
jgi:hypothetical protein